MQKIAALDVDMINALHEMIDILTYLCHPLYGHNSLLSY